MSPSAPAKSTDSYRSDARANMSNGMIYTIDELMELRHVECTQPAKLVNCSPVLRKLLRQNLQPLSSFALYPPMHMDLLSKSSETVQSRIRQFQNSRGRHSTRSVEDFNPRNGCYQQQNGESYSFMYLFLCH